MKLEVAFITEEQVIACVLDADAVEPTRVSGTRVNGLRYRRDFFQGTLFAVVRQAGSRSVVITAYWGDGDRRGKPTRRRPL